MRVVVIEPEKLRQIASVGVALTYAAYGVVNSTEHWAVFRFTLWIIYSEKLIWKFPMNLDNFEWRTVLRDSRMLVNGSIAATQVAQKSELCSEQNRYNKKYRHFSPIYGQV